MCPSSACRVLPNTTITAALDHTYTSISLSQFKHNRTLQHFLCENTWLALIVHVLQVLLNEVCGRENNTLGYSSCVIGFQHQKLSLVILYHVLVLASGCVLLTLGHSVYSSFRVSRPMYPSQGSPGMVPLCPNIKNQVIFGHMLICHLIYVLRVLAFCTSAQGS